MLIKTIEDLRKIDSFQSGERRHLIVVASHEKRAWIFHQLSNQGISLLDIDILLIEEFFTFLKGDCNFPSWNSSLLPAIVSSKWAYENEEAKSYFYKIAVSLFKGSPISIEKPFISIWESLKKQIPELFWNHIPAFKNGFLEECYLSVSVFGISSLSEAILSSFIEIHSLSSIPLFFYTLSPCLHFWSDVKTQQEIQKIIDDIKRGGTNRLLIQASEIALSRKNDLLGNWGVLAREFSKHIEEGPFHAIPSYLIPSHLQYRAPYQELLIPEYLNTSFNTLAGQTSLLHLIQADIISFISKREVKETIENEESLSFVIAPSIIQEVQAFRKYFLQKSSSTVSIGDIFILVPSIDEYRDAFMQVFHSDQKAVLQFWPKSKMEMSVYESESELLSWILSLFVLLGMKKKQMKLRESTHALMNLAFHPLTLRALFAEEAQICEGEFRRYLEKLGIDWYISSIHFAREMEFKGINLIYESGIGDFSSMKEKKIEELIGQSVDGEESSTLLNREMSNAFISLALFFESCDALWSLPISPDTVQKIEDWISPLQKTVSCLSLLEEAIEVDDLEAFEIVIARFVGLSRRFPEVKMSFDWFTSAFQRELFNEISNRQQLRRFTGHIIISDRESFDSIPCTGVAILGAGHEQFPQVTREHLLSHLTEIAPTLLHDPSSIDKQLFLEQLLSSSSWFYCSALSTHKEKEGLHHFSPLVRDLIRYVDQNFIYRDGTTFSQKNVSYIGYEKRVQKSALEPILPSPTLSQKNGEVNFITIKKLIEIAQNPIEPYFISFFHTHSRTLYKLLHYDSVKNRRLRPSRYAEREILIEKLKSTKKAQKKPMSGWPKGHIGLLSNTIVAKSASLINPSGIPCQPLDLFLYDYEYLQAAETEPAIISPITLSREGSPPFFLTGRLMHLSKEKFLFLSSSWEEEIYQRIPEYIIRAYLYYRDGFGSLLLEFQGVQANSSLFADQEAVKRALTSWLLFVSESERTLFPFTPSVIKALISSALLLDQERQCAIEELREILLKEAEKKSYTALGFFTPLLSNEYIAALFDTWARWAIELYGDVASWISSKPFGSS